MSLQEHSPVFQNSIDATATPQASRGVVAREAILGAAIRVVGHHGLPAASLGAIAREAGTSKPAVLYHFGSRDKLLRAVASRAMENFYHYVYHAAKHAESDWPRVAMDALFATGCRPMLAAVRELTTLGYRDPIVAATVQACLEEIDRLVALLLPCPEDEALPLAREVVRSVYGYLSLWICSGQEDPTPYRDGAMSVALKIWAARQLA